MNVKAIFLTLFTLIVLSSCEINIVEEPLPVIIDDREFFIGYYDVEEYSKTFRSHTYYDLNIVRSGNGSSVFLKNFYGAGITVLAEVEGTDIFIPAQDVNGYHIEGDGFIDGNELILYYSVHDFSSGGPVDNCSIVAWR